MQFRKTLSHQFNFISNLLSTICFNDECLLFLNGNINKKYQYNLFIICTVELESQINAEGTFLFDTFSAGHLFDDIVLMGSIKVFRNFLTARLR